METLTNKMHTKTVLLNQGNPEEKREEIRKYFHDTFDIDEQLFEGIKNEEAMYKRADPLRHPVVFYYGHTAVFFINKLLLAKLISKRVNPKFESMFAVGVDEMSWDDLNMNHYDWPPIEEITAYRKEVRDIVDQTITDLPMTLPIDWKNPFWIIMMGIEHARIHFETSSVLMRQLPIEDVSPIKGWKKSFTTDKSPKNKLLPVKGGKIQFGKDRESPTYGWDSEYGRKESEITDFEASKYLCSNAEYLEFINAGGYTNQEYWTQEGWQWKTYLNTQQPRFWLHEENGWKLRLTFEEIKMPWSWPVEVNYLEAKAFCNWKSKETGKKIRLPMEEEWTWLHKNHTIPDQTEWQKAPGNLNMEHFQSPCPVNIFNFGEFYDLIGNVWQWTETPVSGLIGFKIHPFYDDFSTPTFDTQHNIIKGGSWISTGNEATKDARYAFRRHFYQHAGFRYIASEMDISVPEDLYETDCEVAASLHEHWGELPHNFKNYRVEIAKYCCENIPNIENKKILDLGCKTGRTTFELGRCCPSVMGLDFTARMIRKAIELQTTGHSKYEFIAEGEIFSYHHIDVDQYHLNAAKLRIQFYQADPSNLKDLFSGYDLIIVNDALDEMLDPNAFLNDIHKRMKDQGYLIIASAYDWKDENNPVEKRPGGYRLDGELVWSSDGVTSILSHQFLKVKTPTTILSCRQAMNRKYIIREIEVSLWQKK